MRCCLRSRWPGAWMWPRPSARWSGRWWPAGGAGSARRRSGRGCRIRPPAAGSAGSGPAPRSWGWRSRRWRWSWAGRRSRPGRGGPQRRRAALQPRQAVARTGNPLRQARHHLPRCLHPLRLHRLDARVGAEALRQPGVRTQNSLPSESTRHIHGTSSWPTSASVAPRARSRATSAQNRPSAESSRALKFT